MASRNGFLSVAGTQTQDSNTALWWKSKLTLSLSMAFIFQTPPFPKKQVSDLSSRVWQSVTLKCLQVKHCAVNAGKEILGLSLNTGPASSSSDCKQTSTLAFHKPNRERWGSESLSPFWKGTTREEVTTQEKVIKKKKSCNICW